jgi:hypothetical protein
MTHAQLIVSSSVLVLLTFQYKTALSLLSGKPDILNNYFFDILWSEYFSECYNFKRF